MTETVPATVDDLLLEWIQSARIRRTDKQSLLLDALLGPQPCGAPSHTTQSALAVLESVSASTADIQFMRHQAEALTVSCDAELIAAALSSDCAMELRLADTTQVFVGPDAVHAITAELCEQQQSLQTSLTRASTCPTNRRPSAGAPARVRAVSAPQSWLVDPSAPFTSSPTSTTTRSAASSSASSRAEPYESGPLRVGTLVTYYEDSEQRRIVFSVHTVFTFAVDGQRVESIVRTLQSRDGTSAAEALTEVHFGYLLEKSVKATCL